MASERLQHLILSRWYVGINQLNGGQTVRAFQSTIQNVGYNDVWGERAGGPVPGL